MKDRITGNDISEQQIVNNAFYRWWQNAGFSEEVSPMLAAYNAWCYLFPVSMKRDQKINRLKVQVRTLRKELDQLKKSI